MSKLIIDEKARKNAIDPSRSFIVQAPAGSGKTELLTQRFLQLLCYTEKNPEEIIAITFTRKAAAEMRQRVIFALNNVDKAPPENSHKQLTWQLAKKVLARDQKLSWHLLENPNRLRILTIDALSAFLVKQMPLSAQLSPQFTISDNPLPYYRQAAEQVLLTQSVETLLLHLDNRVFLLKELFIEILSKREQWLPHIIGHQNNTEELRKHMEQALRNVAQESLKTTNSHLSNDIRAELIPIANAAGQYCIANDPNNPIASCHNLSEISESLTSLPQWIGIVNLLLTQKGEWRKNVTKRQGFPAKSKFKPKMIDFLSSLSTNEILKSHLHAITLCPPITYDDQQWIIIEALIEILPILAAQLNLVFANEHVIDFVELNIAALRALGEDENPTDLALHLDYRIKHLLIDEFQDTSVTQFQLIEKLIAGWYPNDGRTIFLVGDPMQSIYRFRNAEVGLFLRAQEQGIGNITLETLKLKQNFRSYSAIVDWNNHNFKTIFPNEPNITLGATPYSTAKANHTHSGNVEWHLSINGNDTHESSNIVKQIQTIQKNTPDDTIAILVRSRTHLNAIIDTLHKENIDFHAVDLDPLANLIEIQEIHSLTRALLHRADRIAWLAILRSPYCGLALSDLTIIAQASESNSIWTTLKNYQFLSKLSHDAQCRLQQCLPAFFNAIKNNGQLPLSQLLSRLWQQLNGPDTLTTIQQTININNYFKLIENLESQNKPVLLRDIDERLNKLYAESNANAHTKLHIMTIHKAKGLEFDHVLLPGLHRKASHDKHQILKWLERPNLFGDSDLILAPIKATDQKTDSIYSYLNRIDKLKSDYEYARLLYVATTRAKKSLHLFANATLDEQTIQLPPKGSFLSLLWVSAKPHFLQTKIIDTQEDAIARTYNLRRFKLNYLKTQQKNIMETSIIYTRPPKITLSNATPRYVGIIIHETLQHIADRGSPNTNQWPLRLKQFGVPNNELNICLHTIQQAIDNIQKDLRGQWILSNNHQDAHSELPLSFFDGDQLKQIIIDRCFIDNGVRWIIDYKTGTPSPEELKQYYEQLTLYSRAFQQWENYPIRLGLYFPLTCKWMEYKLLLKKTEPV